MNERAIVDASTSLAKDYWRAPNGQVRLVRGDCIEVLGTVPPDSVDVVFADPPYFLSNGGTTCRSGRRASVDKGKWDRSRGVEENHAFTCAWLEACRKVLKPNGTIWISGTAHVIYSVGFALQQLGFKLLNDIVWEKPNPPPNLSCRYFTHATETLIWAARDRKSKHHFAYDTMRSLNGNRQMKSVWRMSAPSRAEKRLGKHPTQKPEALLERVLLASCPPEGFVVDPFNGSGTSGVVAVRLGHRYLGIDLDCNHLELTRKRVMAEQPAWSDVGPRLRVAG